MSLPSILIAGAASGLFAVLYQNRWGVVGATSLVGALSWGLSLPAMDRPHGAVLADLLGALVAGLLSEMGARRLREPVSVLVVPAVIPFVPGYGAYQSMRAFLDGRFLLGWERASAVMLEAGALAVGLALATAIARSVRGRHTT